MKPWEPWTLALVLIASLLGGCGTVSTVGRADSEIRANLARHDTYCEAMPRVYSGVSYNFCRLHSNPRGIHPLHLASTISYLLWDMTVSCAADTLLLPYTAYDQSLRGPIDL